MFDEATLLKMPMADMAEMPTQFESKLYSLSTPQDDAWMPTTPDELQQDEIDASRLFDDETPEQQAQEAPAVIDTASDIDSFAGNCAWACDDLLNVDQEDIHVELTIPSTICTTPCLPPVEADVFDDSDELSTTSVTTSSTSTQQSREESLASLISSVSKLDSSRRKLLHRMERTNETRRALKRRRLSSAEKKKTDSLLCCLQKTENSHKQIFHNLRNRYALAK